MLQRFELRNFKAFRQQSFELAPITVLVGRNGTGKSSVLQALAFLKQSSQAGEPAYSDKDGLPVLADLGGFHEVAHRGDPSVSIGLALEAHLDSLGPVPWPTTTRPVLGSLPIALSYGNTLRSDAKTEETIQVQPTGGTPYTASSRISGKTGLPLTLIKPSFRGFEAKFIPSEKDIEDFGTPEIIAELYSGLEEEINRLGAALAIQLQRFFFVPAGRGFVGQTFSLQNDASDDLSTAMGYSEFASNAATRLAMDRGLEEQVSDWLEEVTGLRIRAELGKGKTVNITFRPARDVSDRMAVGANNESFGANQLSHVFLQIALAGDEATVGIEEPEVHLHPRAQRDLVETLARIAKEGSRQFIISTHSERIVSRLLVLVAKGVLRTEDLAVYAFDKDEEGVASATRCEIDDLGRITGGIPGFFEESVTDMSEVVAALSSREG